MQRTDFLESFSKELEGALNAKECELLRVKYLGRSGLLTAKLRELGTMSPEERSAAGANLNAIKKNMEQLLEERINSFSEINDRKNIDAYTLTLPARDYSFGTCSLLSVAAESAFQILNNMGFSFFDGPEIETEYYNFDALNTPSHHPARKMQDTFYIENPEEQHTNNNMFLLRTQTSSVQIRAMKKMIEEGKKPPYRVFSIGRVYRKDWDATHTPMFTQIEGLWIDETVSFANMKWCISLFLRRFFESNELKFRFRPSFFPFVDPGSEVDISYKREDDKENQSNWLEVMGCGMVHENVLKNMGVDSEKYQGFAFGIGLERLVMLKYNINDLRYFFNPDLRLIESINHSPFF